VQTPHALCLQEFFLAAAVAETNCYMIAESAWPYHCRLALLLRSRQPESCEPAAGMITPWPVRMSRYCWSSQGWQRGRKVKQQMWHYVP